MYFVVDILGNHCLYIRTKPEKESMMIMSFVIYCHMKNGDVWRSVRRSKKDLDAFIECILKDEGVVKFTVEEKS